MKNYIKKSMTFAEYLRLIDDLLLEGKTTGENQSEEMFNYGKLNRQRMKRLGNTIKLNESLKEKVRSVEQKMIWLIITEGWCGDAAQNIPVIEKIAAENANIETRYILRDENLELMDAYLTNNARSIPKLICLDGETLEEIGTWGPRPQSAMDYFYEMREQEIEKLQMMENLQRWYLQDKEQSLEAEFEKLLDGWAKQNQQNSQTASK
ncbi:MAG: thioredoxin family protein [Acidobacteriota bacterium]|nr:thioredoxin family protein [Acidobacteriota bacterium]